MTEVVYVQFKNLKENKAIYLPFLNTMVYPMTKINGELVYEWVSLEVTPNQKEELFDYFENVLKIISSEDYNQMQMQQAYDKIKDEIIKSSVEIFEHIIKQKDTEYLKTAEIILNDQEQNRVVKIKRELIKKILSGEKPVIADVNSNRFTLKEYKEMFQSEILNNSLDLASYKISKEEDKPFLEYCILMLKNEKHIKDIKLRIEMINERLEKLN